MIKLSLIEENSWNMNKMGKTEYAALLEDMRTGGPDAINPITVIQKFRLGDPTAVDQYVVVDGAHRFRAARELGWEEIPATISTANSEYEARAITYAKNNERGQHDPYLEAEYFQWFIDRGKTHEEIAAMHRVDRTTITKRLSLLKLDPKVRKALEKVPHITVSHLEPISTLEVADQHTAVKDVKSFNRWGNVTVGRVEESVRDLKRARKKNEQLQKAVAKSKYQTCPTCDGAATRHNFEKLPIVSCKEHWGDEHTWNLKTGKTNSQMKEAARAEERKNQPAKKPEPPKTLRTTHTLEEYKGLFTAIIQDLFGEFVEFDEVRLEGKTQDGKHAEIRVHHWANSSKIHVERGMKDSTQWEGPVKNRIHFVVEAKEYKAKTLADIKTVVTPGGWSDQAAKLPALERQITKLFKTHRPKKEGK